MNEALFPNLASKDAESRALLLVVWNAVLEPYEDPEIEAAVKAALAGATFPLVPANVVRAIESARFAASLAADREESLALPPPPRRTTWDASESRDDR